MRCGHRPEAWTPRQRGQAIGAAIGIARLRLSAAGLALPATSAIRWMAGTRGLRKYDNTAAKPAIRKPSEQSI